MGNGIQRASLLLALIIVGCSSNESADNGGASGKGGASGSAGSSGSAGANGSGGAGGSGGVGATDGGTGAFPPNPKLAGLGDESVLDLGAFECTGVAGEDEALCRRTTDYSGFVYDPHRHKMLAFGGGHSTTMTDSIHVLDLGGTLKWTDLYPPTACSEMTAQNLDADNGAWLSGAATPYPRPVSSHTYDMLAVAPKLDEFLVIARTFTGGYCNPVGNDIGGKIAHFDRAANKWSFSPSADGATYDLATNIPGSDPDPVSGKIVLVGGGGLALYDPSSRTYSQAIDTANGDTFMNEAGQRTDISGIGYANHLVYSPAQDKFYLFTRNAPVSVYALSLNRTNPAQSTLTKLTTTGTGPPSGEVGYDYDSVNHVVGGAVQNSMFYAFDPATATWTAHPMRGGTPGNVAFHALAYDPADNVFIFVTDYDSGMHTWAYRLKK